MRPLGNPTTKAWLRGWDAATCGLSRIHNPYKRDPQFRAWEKGWWSGYWAEDAGVRTMKRMVNKMRPNTYTEVA